MRRAARAENVDETARRDEGGGTNTLTRAITGPLLFVFILGDVLGAGIYALVGVIAGEVGGAVWVPLLVALVMALLTATSYAELVTKYPRAGGAAVFAQRAYRKPLISFLVGFSMLAAGVTSAAGLALAFSGDYLKAFIDVPTVPAALVFLLLVGLPQCQRHQGVDARQRRHDSRGGHRARPRCRPRLHSSRARRRNPEPRRGVRRQPIACTRGAGCGTPRVLLFCRLRNVRERREEVKNVSKVYPRALFGALLTAGAAYVLVGLAVSVVLPADELAASSGPLLEVVSAADVGVPPRLFSLIALVAVANGALLTMIMASRLTYGMASEGLLPSVFARVLPQRRTPWVAIIATTAVAMALCVTGSLSALAETVVLLLLFVFISTNIAVLVLRRDAVQHKHFRTPIIFPILALGTCVALLTQQSAATWLRASLLLAVGVVLYALSHRRSTK